MRDVAPLHGDPLAIPYVPSSIADSAPLSIPYVPSSVADSAPLSGFPYVPSSVDDSAPLSARRRRSLARSLARFPYMPSSVADSERLSGFPYVPSSVADSAPLSGSDPELSSFSSGVSDAHRAQAVLTDSDTFASPRSVAYVACVEKVACAHLLP